ncbi:MAG TPA: hypothetical protein VFU35_08400 [Jatrophihabitans sp.]|nr:hypothetical protein [Jatrophihabitans sp.]
MTELIKAMIVPEDIDPAEFDSVEFKRALYRHGLELAADDFGAPDVAEVDVELLVTGYPDDVAEHVEASTFLRENPGRHVAVITVTYQTDLRAAGTRAESATSVDLNPA